jgi:dimethylglycine dehydrogenase
MFQIEVTNADATGGEPIFLADGTPVGQVSSGSYGYSVGASLALGYLKADAAKASNAFNVAILGKPHAAVLLEKPLFDPDGTRLRG